MYKKSLIMVGLAAMAAFGSAQSVRFYQDGRPEKIFRPVSGLDNQDIKFLKQALAADQFEIESSRLALRNGKGQFIQEFAKEMIDDHKAAKSEAIETAQKRGLTPDSTLPQPLQAKLNWLSQLNGWKFDRAYEAAQKTGHEMTIVAFKREVENGRDQLVKAMAVKQLPTVELHYKMLLEKKTMMGDTAMTHGM
jgi:putative membrane protein